MTVGLHMMLKLRLRSILRSILADKHYFNLTMQYLCFVSRS